MTASVQILTYSSPKIGRRLVVLGGVHGNEVCGTKAIRAFLPKLDSGAVEIVAGSVTFVPCCNPLAFERGARYVDHNLNRHLCRKESPKDYEDQVANILCPVLEACDVLLDLHSYHTHGPAFIFAGPDGTEETAFRRSLGPAIEVYGWADGYARALGKANDTTSNGTTEYTRLHGGVALTLECGHHADPSSVDVATQAIENAMAYCGLTERTAKTYPLDLRVRLENVYWRKDNGRLARAWHHLDPIKAGEPFAFDEKGAPIAAEKDGYVILPKETCPVGDEWFYFGVSG